MGSRITQRGWLGRQIAAVAGIAAAAVVALGGGCGNGASEPTAAHADRPDRPLRIVTTTGMVTDLVRNVAGEHAEVSGLMGEGVDPHLYKPSAADTRRVLEADAIFYSGLMLEGRMADTFVRAARMGKPAYAVTELIDESSLLEPEAFEGHWDPHVWMDVAAWSKCIDVVREALAELDPDHAEDFETRAAACRATLAELDSYVKRVMASVPKERRVLVTAHDAFNYFGRAYDVEVMGVQGLSTASEAGLQDINRLVDLLVERKIAAVFVETSVSDKHVQALIAGARQRGHEVIIGGELFSDATGPAGTYEGTYVGMIDHNATTIARALGGEAPERGMAGALSGHGEGGP